MGSGKRELKHHDILCYDWGEGFIVSPELFMGEGGLRKTHIRTETVVRSFGTVITYIFHMECKEEEKNICS